MWDTNSRFTEQSSARCGMATHSGAGFLSRINTSLCGNTGARWQNDPSLRRWQSFSYLAPEDAAQSFPSSWGAELQATRGEYSFKQSEMMQWLQDAHERLDTQLDRLRNRDAQLSYHITTAQLSDMKHKLSEVVSNLKQEKNPTKSSDFEQSQQHRPIHEKVQTFDKDQLQKKTTLDRGTDDEPPEISPESCNRSAKEKQNADTQQCEIREAEMREKTQQMQQNQVHWQLSSSAETQKMLLNQVEELNRRLGNNTRQNYSEMQKQLTEANNKISQTCLEKAILSTQVIKLEDNIKELKAKLTEAQSKKDKLIQVKADQVLGLQLDRTQPCSEGAELHDDAEPHNNKLDGKTFLIEKKSMALKEENEKLARELERMNQKLEMLQWELQEATAQRINSSKPITDLEADKSQLIREKEELLNKMNKDVCEMKEKCCQLSETVKVLQLDKQKLHDQCLCLEAELLEKEQKFPLQEEEHHKQDAVRVQTIEELKATVSHWTEKWQKVALTLQSTQEELKDLKNNSSRDELHVDAAHLASELEKLKERSQKDKEQIDNLLQQKASLEKLLTQNKKESESLLRVELDACKQELELERSRSQMLLHRCKDKGSEAVQSQDKGTVTDLSNFSVLWVPPAELHSSQLKSPQVSVQNSKDQWLRTIAEKEKELQEKAEALETLEKLREMEKNEAGIKISALELRLMKKANKDNHDGEEQANVSTIDTLRAQLEESRRREKQLQQEKLLAVQRLQTLKQLHPIKEENPSVKDRKDKTVYLETDQQRRMVTEQLKNLFKEREEKEKQMLNNTATEAAKTQVSSLQDWTPTPTVVRTAVNRWNWQPSSDLTPVFEEDEEDIELQESDLEEEGCAQENIHNQRDQMSATSPEHVSVKAKHVNLLQALRFKQPHQDQDKTTADVDVPNLRDECDMQEKPYFLCPDGIFLAEPVNICSPDEDEEEEQDK